MIVKETFSRFADELKRVDSALLDLFRSDAVLIPAIGRHILGSGGKRIRPLFLLLSADLCGYTEPDRVLLAAIIEAIHTASLLHDDVIDGAETRRGRPASHALWGNQIVVLVGDFLYATALKHAVAQRNQKVMEALSGATSRMTEGEILQLHKTGDPDITEKEYFDIISAKTGVLISAACRIGAILANQTEDREQALSRFGMKTGVAFQLADDVLDYVANQEDLGKRLGKDMEEGKITMPLIHLLKVASEGEKSEIRALIKECGARHDDGDSRNNGNVRLSRLTDLFEKYEAIEASMSSARALVEEAKSELDIFPLSREKDALLAMADYAMERDR
ncbi:MAG TPA: polyprenyl synthetase family protein [Dissulfurispiraceae bacterium]|nr:polyprenyl synthetase family protein [Dissulfurispiraceae bacterium]